MHLKSGLFGSNPILGQKLVRFSVRNPTEYAISAQQRPYMHRGAKLNAQTVLRAYGLRSTYRYAVVLEDDGGVSSLEDDVFCGR